MRRGLKHWCIRRLRASGELRAGRRSAQADAQEAFFQPLAGGEGPLDDFADSEDRRSAPMFGYR